MIKFKATHFNAISAKIEKVEVTRETRSVVYLPDGRRESKETEWHSYHNTWDEAHAKLLKHAYDMLASARRRLQQVQGYSGNIKGMRNPDALPPVDTIGQRAANALYKETMETP